MRAGDIEPVSGIVLAGGLSQRMGQDKASLPWNGRPLLSHAVETLRPLVKEVTVVARPGQDLPETRAHVVTDRIIGAGPLAGLESGLAAMETPYGIAVACDMPWLNASLLEAMIPWVQGCDLVIPCVSGRVQPLHAVYAKRLQPIAADLLARGERRLQALMEHAKVRMLEESFIRSHDPLCRSVRSVDNWRLYREAIQGGLKVPSITQYYEQDHDRLDDLFKQFRQLKEQDRGRARECFQQFKAGLLRHVAWEEEILFPAFDEKNGFQGVGPTEVMRREHLQIKGWLNEIDRRLHENAESGSEEEALAAVLQTHNHKEEWILYPAIDGQLSE